LLSVVELISMLLQREGVQYLFGIPGQAGIIDLLDATEMGPVLCLIVSGALCSPYSPKAPITEQLDEYQPGLMVS
jgi:hypothetical protein